MVSKHRNILLEFQCKQNLCCLFIINGQYKTATGSFLLSVSHSFHSVMRLLLRPSVALNKLKLIDGGGVCVSPA